MKALKKKMAGAEGTMSSLAGQRASYVNLTAKVKQHQEQFKQLNDALSKAKGRVEASDVSSLITRIDEPTTGTRPAGPGRTLVVLASTLGGLTLGSVWCMCWLPGEKRLDSVAEVQMAIVAVQRMEQTPSIDEVVEFLSW